MQNKMRPLPRESVIGGNHPLCLPEYIGPLFLPEYIQLELIVAELVLSRPPVEITLPNVRLPSIELPALRYDNNNHALIANHFRGNIIDPIRNFYERAPGLDELLRRNGFFDFNFARQPYEFSEENPAPTPREQTNAEKLVAWGYTGEIPEDFLCYVTGAIMTDPVVVYPRVPIGNGAADAEVEFAAGATLDRSALLEWLGSHHTDPRTRAPVDHVDQIVRNADLRQRIDAFMESVKPAQTNGMLR